MLDDEIDFEMADVADEMNILMSEIQSETGRSKPQAKERTITPRRKILNAEDTELTKAEAEDTREDDLQAEIARIKREMEEELG